MTTRVDMPINDGGDGVLITCHANGSFTVKDTRAARLKVLVEELLEADDAMGEADNAADHAEAAERFREVMRRLRA